MDHYYQIYQSLPMNRKLFYISLLIFSFIFLSKFIFHIGHIFALLVTLLIMAWLITGDSWFQNLQLTDANDKLTFLNNFLSTDSYGMIGDDFGIQPPLFGSYLDKDPTIIDFYFTLSDYSNYNLPSFRKSLLYTNNLLGIENFVNHTDYAVKKPQEYLDQAETAYKEALNNMHSLIFSLPSTTITYYTFNNSLQKLEHLLIQHLDNVKNLAKRQFDQCDLNIDSKPIHDYFASPDDRKEKGYSMNYSMY